MLTAGHVVGKRRVISGLGGTEVCQDTRAHWLQCICRELSQALCLNLPEFCMSELGTRPGKAVDKVGCFFFSGSIDLNTGGLSGVVKAKAVIQSEMQDLPKECPCGWSSIVFSRIKTAFDSWKWKRGVHLFCEASWSLFLRALLVGLPCTTHSHSPSCAAKSPCWYYGTWCSLINNSCCLLVTCRGTGIENRQ